MTKPVSKSGQMITKEVKNMRTPKILTIAVLLLCALAVLAIPAQPVSASKCCPQAQANLAADVIDLEINPASTTPGQKVTVRALVANPGDQEQSFIIDLEINGDIISSQNVTLTAGESRFVDFTYTPDAPGTYTVTVGRISATLEVSTQPDEPVTPKPEGKFRQGPVVRLRPVTDQISSSTDGLVELFFSNPGLNEVTLQVDVYISVPSGIHVYGEGFGSAAGAGTVYGQFTVPPGMARTVYLNIKADRTAVGNSYFLHFQGSYWPDGNKDAWNPISLTHPFKVLEASPNPMDPKPTQDMPGAEAGGISWTWSGWGRWIILALVVLAGIAVIAAVMSRRTEVSLER